MRLEVAELADLDFAIRHQVRSDYIYMYPPRQAYRRLKIGEDSVRKRIVESFRGRNRLNVYVHVPFCRQICGFCNLYTTSIRSQEVHRKYVESVLKQIDAFLPLLPQSEIPTIYIGGGTPTVLDRNLLRELVQGALAAFPNRTTKCEIAIEADPQTVDEADLNYLRQLGINRINLGLQSRVDGELQIIGRRYRSAEQWQLAAAAMLVGFDNVCLDLIYGLPGQTLSSWSRSVHECIDLNPQTICCYPLTERPHTGFAKQAHVRSSESDYEMWEHADHSLREAGYDRQSHVRWAREGGGYRQKELHWGSENLIGFGAGARSYLHEIDLRANYSIGKRRYALDLYLHKVTADNFLPDEGFDMSVDERLRKAVILGIHRLDADETLRKTGIDPFSTFGSQFDGLVKRKLLTVEGRRLSLTDEGMKYRDLVVQMFFSERVRQLTTEFSYDE